VPLTCEDASSSRSARSTVAARMSSLKLIALPDSEMCRGTVATERLSLGTLSCYRSEFYPPATRRATSMRHGLRKLSQKPGPDKRLRREKSFPMSPRISGDFPSLKFGCRKPKRTCLLGHPVVSQAGSPFPQPAHGIAIDSRLQDRCRANRVPEEAQHRNAAVTFSDAPLAIGARSRCTGNYVDDHTTAAPPPAYGLPDNCRSKTVVGRQAPAARIAHTSTPC
jgi:hypothetical protein